MILIKDEGLMPALPQNRDGRGWASILEEGEEARARGVVRTIATALCGSELVRLFGPSLGRGSAGAALFFSYLSMNDHDYRWQGEARAWLTHAAEGSGSCLGVGLFDGLTGIAWSVEHVRSLGLPVLNEHPPMRIEVLLGEQLDARTWTGSYDLASGLVGIGLYALESGCQGAATLLDRIVARLDELAVRTGDGVTWWTAPEHVPDPQRKLYREGYFNLGLAHGVPGVIALLARACAANMGPKGARTLLDGATQWLLAQRLKSPAVSCFDTVVAKHEPNRRGRGSRIAWCYGDLGVSAALYVAGVCVREDAWKREALDIARRTAARPVGQSGVVDAGLCHGSAGVAHIFNRFYQATGEEVFARAARMWFVRTLSFYSPGLGVGGFRARMNHEQAGCSEWCYVPGMLEGSAGIGLALLAAIGSIEPAWDRLLMISIPPSGSK